MYVFVRVCVCVCVCEWVYVIWFSPLQKRVCLVSRCLSPANITDQLSLTKGRSWTGAITKTINRGHQKILFFHVTEAVFSFWDFEALASGQHFFPTKKITSDENGNPGQRIDNTTKGLELRVGIRNAVSQHCIPNCHWFFATCIHVTQSQRETVCCFLLFQAFFTSFKYASGKKPR